MDTAGAPSGRAVAPGSGGLGATGLPRNRTLAATWARLRYPLAVYAATRLLYLALALLDTLVRHDARGHGWSVYHELANWDGKWYLLLTTYGYPQHVSHAQTTLGFFPLYPMLTWVLAHGLGTGYESAGLLIAFFTGAVATVLVGRLAEGWWGASAGRRAVLFFCVFPGSIVFSMVYTEGLLLALVAGCLLALERRRWALAGVLAGLATAVGPVATSIVLACAGAAALELRRHGRNGLRSLVAPALAPAGMLGLAAFMWTWTGSPTAVYQAQRYGWHESTTPWAIPRVAESLIQEIAGTAKIHPNINLNLIAGLLGTGFLVWALVLLWRHRERVPLPAMLWTAGIAFLTLTSNATPPNARMLICAFPAVIVVAAHLRGRAFHRLIGVTLVLCVAMSMVTFVGTGLRP